MDEQIVIPTIAVIGTGPKSAALHVLACSLEKLGRKSVKIVSYDKTAAAANWDGKHGYTDGSTQLDTSPLKDLAYPGSFGKDVELDQELAKFSWSSYLKYEGTYDQWIDRGLPHCSHYEWAGYLRWALRESKADCRFGNIVRVEPSGDKVKLVLNSGASDEYDGVVFTGPGKPRKLVSKLGDRCFDSISFWKSTQKFKGNVAVVGEGPIAGAILKKLGSSEKNMKIHMITEEEILHSKDRSYFDNQLLSNPAKWTRLSEPTRRNFLRELEIGTLSSKSDADKLLTKKDFTLVHGSVVDVKNTWGKVELVLDSTSNTSFTQYDFVVFATGFDPIGDVRDILSEEYELPIDDEKIKLEIGENFCLPLEKSKVHVPGIGALSQGPGFQNLSCLGLMAKRIIYEYTQKTD